MKYVAAIDLGTSKIMGMIAQKEGEVFTILEVEKEDASSSMRRGYVHNVNDVPIKIKRIIKKLENKFGKTISHVYVNINGQSLRSENNAIAYSVKDDEPITQELLDKLKKDAAKKQLPPDTEVLEVVDPEYFIKNVRELSPVGVSCSQIECKYKLLVGRPAFKRKIERCFNEIVDTDIAGYMISPVATAAAVLSESDKEMGCALVEFGAGITSLSIYKNGLLRYMVAIPFGGENVTQDICTLGVAPDYADKLKLEIGDASNPQIAEKGKTIRLQSAELPVDTPEVDVKKLNECISARETEIIANVLNQINVSGYNDKLGAGIIIAGGASQMKGLLELFKSMTTIEVKKADFMIPIEANRPDIVIRPGYEQILGMLWLAEKSCIKEEEIIEIPDFDIVTDDKENPPASPDKKGKKEKKETRQPTGSGSKNKKGGFLSKFGRISGFLFEDENTKFKDEDNQ